MHPFHSKYRLSSPASIRRGFTLIEIIIAVSIVSMILVIGGPRLTGLFQKQKVIKAGDQVKGEIIQMRSRAISRLRTQRMNILSNKTYQFEEDTTGAGNWEVVVATVTLPSDVTFRQFDVDNKVTSLEFDPNGLPNFNGADASPFVTVVQAPSDTRRGVYVSAGGAVDIDKGAADQI